MRAGVSVKRRYCGQLCFARTCVSSGEVPTFGMPL